MPELIRHLTQHEQLNFLLTNRIPRHLLTRFMGWYSQLQSPLLTKLSIAIWRQFTDDLNLSEAKQQTFNSLHQCFIRELKDSARPIDKTEDIVISPCDAVVGACGRVDGNTVYQAKGFPYELHELIPDHRIADKYRNGLFITLRLKSSMYHRFHAPTDCRVNEVNYISGDTWNVNPIALKRIEKLFCKNERAVVDLNIVNSHHNLALVPVAAILVASMKFNCLNKVLNIKYRGPNRIPCSAQYRRGDEMGYFQHGSTIIVFASPNHQLCEGINNGARIKMGEPLLQQIK